MLQHMMLSFFLPPLVLMATPEWLLRVLVGEGRFYRVVAFLTRPVIAAVLFNTVVIVSHIPGVVSASLDSGPLHYSVHFAVVMSSLIMWMPVVGPFPELQISPIGKIIYLFIQSLVPTIPAAWLTFADNAVYKSYDQPVRVWGLSVVHDQQLAGAIMKTGGGIFLWAIIIFLFFKRFVASSFDYGNTYRRTNPIPDAELTGDDSVDTEEPLTTADVERAFAQVAAPPDDRTD
jgi:putative membrane protein